MIEFIQNPWTIGITGGLISGFLVFFITNKYFSRKENKEYQQRLNNANSELLYAIRPLIVSKLTPNEEIIESLIIATSKKFNVKDTDVYNAKSITDLLIKEILDNPFLDSDNKLKYCEIIKEIIHMEKSAVNELKNEIVYVEKNQSQTKEISFVLAIVSTMTVLISVISMYADTVFIKSYELLALMITATTIPILALFFTKLLRIFKSRKIGKIDPDGNFKDKN